MRAKSPENATSLPADGLSKSPTRILPSSHVNRGQNIASMRQRPQAEYTQRCPNIGSKVALDWYISSIVIRKTMTNKNRHI